MYCRINCNYIDTFNCEFNGEIEYCRKKLYVDNI